MQTYFQNILPNSYFQNILPKKPYSQKAEYKIQLYKRRIISSLRSSMYKIKDLA
jgi:hypothetical protein